MSMDPQLAPVRPGEILAGRYRVERVIGIGGMGVVVAAMHLQLEQLVALKFLLPHALDSSVVVARFTREARAAVRIKSEHIARIMDVGTLESGAPYMVMEYLEGSDLAALLRSVGRLPIDDAVDYILQACEAIAEAHRLGIVHRDLKPANLFLARTDGVDSIKVLDFGISKMSSFTASGSEVGTMTHTGVLLGSPMYMSPEQLTSPREVDARTDIWSLGVVLHQLLAGEPPFNGTTVTQISIGVVQQGPPMLERIRPEVSPGLAAAVRRCLEKNRAQRFANIEEFARALQDFAPPRSRASLERIHWAASGQPIADAGSPLPFELSRSLLDGSQGASGPTATDDTQGEWVGAATRRWVRPRRRGLRLVVGGASLAAAAVAFWLLLGRPRPASETVLVSGQVIGAESAGALAGSPPNRGVSTAPTSNAATTQASSEKQAIANIGYREPSIESTHALSADGSDKGAPVTASRAARPTVQHHKPLLRPHGSPATPDSAHGKSSVSASDGWEDER
jgi:serine/threonine protein kinase